MEGGLLEICDEFLLCQICQQVPRPAKLLNCLHSFCLSCLYKKFGKISHGETDLQCPKCECITAVPAKGVVGLRDNVLLQRLSHVGGKETLLQYLESGGLKQNGNFSKADQGNNELEPKGPDIACEQCGVNAGADDAGKDEDETVDEVSCEEINRAQYHCSVCDVYVCEPCQLSHHGQHTVFTIPDARTNKHKYLSELLDDMTALNNKFNTQALQLANALNHLKVSTSTVIKEIEDRAAMICSMIQQRKTQLVTQIKGIQQTWEVKYSEQQTNLGKRQDALNGACAFTNMVLTKGIDRDVIDMTGDLANRLHQLSAKTEENGNGTTDSVAVFNLKLDVPDWARDDLVWDKALGSLISGVIHCGTVYVSHTFDIDLTWPTGMAQTKDHNFVVVGKTGALEQQGKVMYYNRHGQLLNSCDLGNTVPFDVVSLPAGDVLVSGSGGQIIQFSQYGDHTGTMQDKFKGTGRMAVTPQGHVMVTSSDEKKVLVYDITGKLKWSFPGPWMQQQQVHISHPHYIASNAHNETVVSDFKENTVFVFNTDGDLVFTYDGPHVEDGKLKCSSAVCCDSFDNILVADFMADSVHLISRSGSFLGHLVTSNNGISCPNFMTVDSDGHLFIGQYGGHITVFQYLSHMRLV